MRLFLFNPENDIALAGGARHFTPPKQAAALHRAGAALPRWLGTDEDYILVPPGCEDIGNLCVSSFDDIPLKESLSDVRLAPWGWSLDTIEQFRRAGVPASLLAPYECKVDSYRRLSHRQNQLTVLNRLQRQGIQIDYPMPICAKSAQEAKRFVVRHGSAMIKSPWSSSGRGVFPVTEETFAASLPRIEGVIRSQGAVMVEPLLTKLLDFALLFDIAPAGAEFVGISVFQNSTAKNYSGNIVASQQDLRTKIEKYVTHGELDKLILATARAVGETYGGEYEGPLGVDMMVYAGDDGLPLICPCIEVNLRYTMGFVALGIYQKLGVGGTLSVIPYPQFKIQFAPSG